MADQSQKPKEQSESKSGSNANRTKSKRDKANRKTDLVMLSDGLHAEEMLPVTNFGRPHSIDLDASSQRYLNALHRAEGMRVRNRICTNRCIL